MGTHEASKGKRGRPRSYSCIRTKLRTSTKLGKLGVRSRVPFSQRYVKSARIEVGPAFKLNFMILQGFYFSFPF